MANTALNLSPNPECSACKCLLLRICELEKTVADLSGLVQVAAEKKLKKARKKAPRDGNISKTGTSADSTPVPQIINSVQQGEEALNQEEEDDNRRQDDEPTRSDDELNRQDEEDEEDSRPTATNEMDTDIAPFVLVARRRKRPRTISNSTEGPSTSDERNVDTNSVIKVPPLVLKNEGDYMKVTAQLDKEGVKCLSTKATRAGVIINVESANDYRRSAKTLDNMGIEYHTFSLESAKPLKIVLRGIPVSQGIEDWVLDTLRSRGFDPTSVARMRSGRSKKPLQMVLVTTPKTPDAKILFNLAQLGKHKIRVESLRPKTGISQCHRCQGWRHSQSNCKVRVA